MHDTVTYPGMLAALCRLTGHPNHNPCWVVLRGSYAVETKHRFLAEHAGGAVLDFFDRMLASRRALIF